MGKFSEQAEQYFSEIRDRNKKRMKDKLAMASEHTKELHEAREKFVQSPTSCSDPAEDADAMEISFTSTQAAWINHHIRNALVLFVEEFESASPNDLARVRKVRERMLKICAAADERAR